MAKVEKDSTKIFARLDSSARRRQSLLVIMWMVGSSDVIFGRLAPKWCCTIVVILRVRVLAIALQERNGGRNEWTNDGMNEEGISANADPHYQKLCSRVAHYWGNRRLQPNRSAMERPRPGGSTWLIMDAPEPGKYAFQRSPPITHSQQLLRRPSLEGQVWKEIMKCAVQDG